MKIAYLITVYSEFEHLKRLIHALDDTDVRFFIHVDAKSKMPKDFLTDSPNVTFVPRIKVWWGGWSHVEAIISLMREAAKGDFDYCALISGCDYPIRSNETIFAKLREGGEFITAVPGFRKDKPEKRIKYYYFDGFDRRKKNLKLYIFKSVEIGLRMLFIRKHNYPYDKIYAGIVWSALSMGCVRYILDYIDANPRFVSSFRTSLIPEEFFFHTIIGNSPFADNIKGALTYMDWDDAFFGPNLISERHLPLLKPGVKYEHKLLGCAYEPMFARKFNDRSGKVLDEIDKLFRKNIENNDHSRTN